MLFQRYSKLIFSVAILICAGLQCYAQDSASIVAPVRPVTPQAPTPIRESRDVRPARKPTVRSGSRPTTGELAGHEWVDLGLKSKLKWATCNIGATTPAGYGDFFAWGEIISKDSFTKENSLTFGKIIGEIGGDPACDAARAHWGETWRLPTRKEIYELVHKCTWEWTTQDGHNGYKITGPNKNSIFLPAAGWCGAEEIYDEGILGRYWTSTPYDEDFNYSSALYFIQTGHNRKWFHRHAGYCIRPVTK